MCILGYWVRRLGMHTGILGQEVRYAYWDTGQEGMYAYCGFWGSLHFEVKV